jgi:two-component system OmpR family response regulator
MEKYNNKRYKVFLVDDDTKHLVMLKNHLEKKSVYNIEINIFSSGESCLDRLHEKPDVIVLDYYLDGIRADAANGLEILRKILVVYPEAQVIMMSGQDNIKVAIDTIDNGAYDYIIKGESAYLRAQMIIDHIIKNKNMGKFLMEQKQKENILIGTIIFMFLVLVIFALATRGFI